MSAIFSAVNISKNYGDFHALSGCDIACNLGQIHALIGTNGAGKSTMIDCLSGAASPSGGNIYFYDHDITKLSLAAKARLGIARTFQKTNIFQPLTVWDNCKLAVAVHHQSPWHIFKNYKYDQEINDKTAQVIENLHLKAIQDKKISQLSHGQKRLVEIALCLANNPKILLLDEPLAGMGNEETAQILDYLKKLSHDHAILLVEHDMKAVFAVADVISVLINGVLIAHGTAGEIQQNPAVQAGYLGTNYIHHG